MNNMTNSIEQLENGTLTDKIITLKSVFKTGRLTVTPKPDGRGWYLGVPQLSETKKQDLTYWSKPDDKFRLEENTSFDLSNEMQKATWEWVKHVDEIAPDYETCQSIKGALFYVHMENKQAATNVSRREQRFKAEKYIMEDNAVNYPQRAELLGVDMSGESPIVIKEYLLDCVNSRTKDILALYEGHDVSLRILLLNAKKKNIITVDEAGIYRYGTIILGTTDASCLLWMQDMQNKHLFETLESEVNPNYITKKQTLDPMIKVREAEDKAKAEADALESANDTIARLEAEVKAGKKALEAEAKKVKAKPGPKAKAGAKDQDDKEK